MEYSLNHLLLQVAARYWSRIWAVDYSFQLFFFLSQAKEQTDKNDSGNWIRIELETSFA